MNPFDLRATLPALLKLTVAASAQDRPVARAQRLADDVAPGRALPLQIGGRVVTGGEGLLRYRRHWPGS